MRLNNNMFFRLSKGFKINAPFMEDNTPIHNVDLEEGVLGKANKNGTILIADDLPQEDHESIIDHEEIHIDQIKRGDLDYDDENVYWKGKAYPRSKMKEGAKNLPWELEAYKRS